MKISHDSSVYVSRQVFYFLGVSARLRQLLEDPLTSDALRLPDIRESPDARGGVCCNIWESRGWWERVVEGRGRNADSPPTDFGRENDGRNIVLAMNADGFQPWRRLNRTITPFTCMILNLPENLRHQSRFIMIPGLIPGPRAPAQLNPYLTIIVEELKQLWTHGLQYTDPHTGQQRTVRVKLLMTCADYPAHGDLNMQQGAGATYGCIKCHVKVRKSRSSMMCDDYVMIHDFSS